MKLSIKLLSILVVGNSATASAGTFSNQGCIKKWYEDLNRVFQYVSVYPEDNRGLLSIRGPEEGLKPRDVQRAEENIGTIFCPSHVPGQFHATGASIIGSNDQLVTNLHAFMDEKNNVYDPLSKCMFKQVALTDERGAVMHALNLKNGAEGLKQLQAMGLLKLGTFPGDKTDDYAVVKLKEPIPWVKPYRLAPHAALHNCKVDEPCQRMISISPFQERMPIKVKDSALILQSSILEGVIPEHDGQESRIFSNTSSTDQASGTLQFLRDDNGTLVRGSDGELAPIAILARSMDKSHDGQPYKANGENRVYTYSVGLDGKVASDIQTLVGKTQTAEIPEDSSLPSNTDSN